MKANVHILAIVRIDVHNVEGTSDRHILEKAEKRVDLENLRGRLSFDVTYEYDGNVEGYLIDELDDRGNRVDSREFDKHMDPEDPGLREDPCVSIPVGLLRDAVEALEWHTTQDAKLGGVKPEEITGGKECARLKSYIADVNPERPQSATARKKQRKKGS